MARAKPVPVSTEFAAQEGAGIGQKNKDHSLLGKAQHPSGSAQGSEDHLSLSLRRRLLQEGQGTAGLVMPCVNSEAMNAHPAEISRTVQVDAHAVLLLDQAGWHTSSRLQVPANITLLPLPSRSPKINPVENIWQFLRDNWLSPIGSSVATKTSSITAARHGTSWSHIWRASHP